jgi:hypothetical protein
LNKLNFVWEDISDGSIFDVEWQLSAFWPNGDYEDVAGFIRAQAHTKIHFYFNIWDDIARIGRNDGVYDVITGTIDDYPDKDEILNLFKEMHGL